jgi:hypothetical protein
MEVSSKTPAPAGSVRRVVRLFNLGRDSTAFRHVHALLLAQSNRELDMENAFLKKAAAYFPREPR